MAIGDWLHFLTGGITTKKGREGLFGSEDKIKKFETMSPEQKNVLNSILGQLMQMQQPGGAYGQATGLLQDYLNPESDIYKNFEAPYRREFEEQTIPGLAERFAGAGATGGALSSSGFGQALGAAGAGLQENLASMKGERQRQSIQDLLGQFNTLSQFGLGSQPFGYMNKPGSAGLISSAAPAFLKSYFGG